jgi:hypothetical protein
MSGAELYDHHSFMQALGAISSASGDFSRIAATFLWPPALGGGKICDKTTSAEDTTDLSCLRHSSSAYKQTTGSKPVATEMSPRCG